MKKKIRFFGSAEEAKQMLAFFAPSIIRPMGEFQAAFVWISSSEKRGIYKELSGCNYGHFGKLYVSGTASYKCFSIISVC